MSIYTELIAKIKAAKSERASLGVMVNAISDGNVGEREKLAQAILENSAEVMAALRSAPKEAAKPSPAVAAKEPAKSVFGVPPEPHKPKP